MQSRKSFGPKGLIIYSSLYISSVELKLTLWNHFGEVFKVMESLFFFLTPRNPYCLVIKLKVSCLVPVPYSVISLNYQDRHHFSSLTIFQT